MCVSIFRKDDMKSYVGLRKIAPLAESYMLPPSLFNPSGKWTHTYRSFTLSFRRLTSSGILTISREPKSEGEIFLDIKMERPAVSGFTHYTHAEMVCREDAIATPLQWSVTTKVSESWQDIGYLYSQMTKTVCAEQNDLIFICGSAKERIAMPVNYTCRYDLFESLQRAVPSEFNPIRFSCMDEFDEPSSGHCLEFRETVPVSLGSGLRELNLFIHTGPGFIPAEYWVDSSGRLLFFISGIEVLVLEEENGEAISFRNDAGVFADAALR